MRGQFESLVVLSSWSEDSFATPRSLRRIEEAHTAFYTQIPRANRTGFRAGGALGVPLGSAISRIAKLNLGYSIGQGPKLGGISKSIGATLDGGFLSLGYTKTEENLSVQIPKTENNTFTAALTSGPIYIGYTRIRYDIYARPLDYYLAPDRLTVYKAPPFSIYSFRFTAKRIALYLALKEGDSYDDKKNSYAFSGQFKVSQSLVLSYIYGLYAAKHSASLQLYF